MIVISKNITLCTTIFKQATGLMFIKEHKDFAYIFLFSTPRKITITMWWVFYPIDIIFLDKDNIVVDKVISIKPFTFFRSKQKAQTFIELPRNTIKEKNISLGDQIHWTSNKLYKQ
jgi:uncharacterized protein